MGWDIHNTRLSAVEDITRTLDNAQESRGAWYGIGKSYTGEPIIVVALLEREFDGHAVKYIAETMHPYAYHCPQALLDAVPCPDSEDARAWRARMAGAR